MTKFINIISPLDQFEIRHLLSLDVTILGNLSLSISNICSFFILTFSLSFAILLGWTILVLIKHGIKLFSFLLPAGCPLYLLPLLVLIEFISYLAEYVSFALNYLICNLLLFIQVLFYLVFMTQAPYGKVVKVLKSNPCQHGAQSIALCLICRVQHNHDAIACCTHKWYVLNKDHHVIGTPCDFSSIPNSPYAFHSVANTIADVVYSCSSCHAIICSHCFVG